MDDRLSASSNPGNRLLATNPGGGTNPTREPRGNTGSAADAGRLARETVTYRQNAMNRSIMSRFLRKRGQSYSWFDATRLGAFLVPAMSRPYGHHRAKP